ncbi:MAG: UPF0262 family protein [Pseudomonadota bacterium]|nr:UPF0262 family protein [Pseudomonadota bacterium]
MSEAEKSRLYEVLLDEATLPRLATDQDHERAVAIFDLVEENSFALPGRDDGPYSLVVAQLEAKLSFEVKTEAGVTAAEFVVSMTPFRPLLKDYFLVCETYYSAIRTASPREIEAIDRERTALHNEGADLLAARLADKVEIDKGTARRMFALISALHWK